MDEELNKAAEEYATDTFPISEETYVDYRVKCAFIAGAQWQAEQDDRDVVFWKGMQHAYARLKEEAVEGEIQMRYSGCLCAKTIRAINEDKFKLGDKVRIIVLPKEDEK